MQYIEAPSEEKPKFKSVFLAGGITNCPDWQKEAAGKLKNFHITVFNPRRKVFPKGKSAAEKQIKWECKRLRAADLVSFWFSEGTVEPITLFELGSALERNIPIIIGVHPDYARREDIEIQSSLMKPNLKIVYSLGELVKKIKSLLGEK